MPNPPIEVTSTMVGLTDDKKQATIVLSGPQGEYILIMTRQNLDKLHYQISCELGA